MRTLILFLIRNNALFLFLLLEIISFWLIVQNNSKQGKVYLSSSNFVSGELYEYKNSIGQYWKLSNVNRDLASENAQLREQLISSRFEHTTEVSLENDSLYEQQYQYLTAKVINNSIIRSDNYLTINRGKKHGIQENMGVISTDKGIVGIVRKASKNHAVIMSILHRNTNISAKIKRTGFFGSLRWQSADPRRMHLEDVPKHAKVAPGDTVITSGFSSMFPEGIEVGTIESINILEGSNVYSIEVLLSNDLSVQNHVYAIQNLMKEEQEELEEPFKNE